MNTLQAFGIAFGLFAGMLALLETGRRAGQARLAGDTEAARAGMGVVEGAVFGLLGLMIAFTFSGAAGRFEARRDLIVQEANAIGTAYLRLDLLPEEPRAALRGKFRRYLDERLAVYAALPDLAAARAALDRSAALQGEIWTGAVAASRAAPAPAAQLLLPALNEMFDITTTRTAATLAHPPPVIFLMLGALALLAAFLAGHGMAGGKRRDLSHMLIHALVFSAAIYLILDLEYPRLGLIRIDAADSILEGVRRGMD